MSDETLSALVLEALPAALKLHGETGASVSATVHAYLWPSIRACVEAELSTADVPTAPPSNTDRRAKPWQYVVRFWLYTPSGPELAGETAPEIMNGTGEIPTIVANLAAQLHEGTPDELKPDAVKALLPQFRNNLGRANTAALRIPYIYADAEYLCQTDVYRLADS